MSELDPEDPRVQSTLRLLMQNLGIFIGRPLNDNSMLAIRTLIEQTSSDFKKLYGHDFPPLVPLILPSSRFVTWFRQDLDDDEVRIKVLNLLREFCVTGVPVSESELAIAMKLTWPQYEPPLDFYRQARQVNLLQ